MKKAVILSVILLFSFVLDFAYADGDYYSVGTLQEQMIEPWEATYQTEWRTIEVDVQPTVPDVQNMPVLIVTPAFWVPDTNDTISWSAKLIGSDDDGDAFQITAGDIWGEENAAKQGKKVESESYYVYAPLQLDEAYAPNNTLTLQQMYDMLQRIMNFFLPDHFSLDWEHLLYARIGGYVDKSTGEHILPSLISIDVNTTLREVPIWGHVIDSIDRRKNTELSYEPRVYFTMRNQDSFSLIGRTVAETSEIAADIPLCSFEAIRQALEEEIEDGHIRAIFSVDLGYALYNVPGSSRSSQSTGRQWRKTAEFYAAPTWRCVCLYTNQTKKELADDVYSSPYTSVYYKTLYVNAQTGKLIDPEDYSKGCGDYPGFITWNDVE